MTDQDLRNQDCRWAVRHYLAVRASGAQDVDTIQRRMNRTDDWTRAELQAALLFLAGLGQVESAPDPLGSLVYYRITPAGTLAHERHQ